LETDELYLKSRYIATSKKCRDMKKKCKRRSTREMLRTMSSLKDKGKQIEQQNKYLNALKQARSLYNKDTPLKINVINQFIAEAVPLKTQQTNR